MSANAVPAEGKPVAVEIKNNKIVFKQKPMSLDKQSETLQGTSEDLPVYPAPNVAAEIVQFRSMLEERASKQEGPLDSIPDNYKPVIGKLAFERCVLVA